jgi:hypothetical protein
LIWLISIHSNLIVFSRFTFLPSFQAFAFVSFHFLICDSRVHTYSQFFELTMYSHPGGVGSPAASGSPQKPYNTVSPVIIRPKGKSTEKKKVSERPLRGSLGRSPAKRMDRKEEEAMLWHGVLDFDDYHNEKP